MLETAQKFEEAFNLFEEADSQYRTDLSMGDGIPEHEDWENVRRLNVFLKHFYTLTVKVSGTSYATINTFLDDIYGIYCILRDRRRHPDVELQTMAKKMKEKFDKYWENIEKMNKLLYVASILDPWKKLVFVEFCLRKMYSNEQASSICVSLKKTMEKLLLEY